MRYYHRATLTPRRRDAPTPYFCASCTKKILHLLFYSQQEGNIDQASKKIVKVLRVLRVLRPLKAINKAKKLKVRLVTKSSVVLHSLLREYGLW